MTHTIRRRAPVVSSTILIGITGALPVGIALLCAGLTMHVALFALFAIVTAGWLWLLTRALRLRFVVDDRGILVRNLFGTHRFAWAEIARLTTGAASLGMQTQTGRMEVHVHLVYGKRIRVTASNTACEKFDQLLSELAPVDFEHAGIMSAWT